VATLEGMIGRLQPLILATLFLTCVTGAQGQVGQPQVSSAFAMLMTGLDTKSAHEGQEFRLRTLRDLAVNGKVVIPANSIILGHVSKVAPKSKANSQAAIALVIDKAIITGGHDLNIQAIIAAVAAPKENSLTSDPTHGMLHSNEPRMSGSGAGTASRTGDLTASSKASSTAAVATAAITGPMEEGFLLNENSTGAIGYEGLELSWGLAAPPPFTIFVSKSKNIKLNVGTQVLLRMAPPHLPQ
jgi:hypothetical protein